MLPREPIDVLPLSLLCVVIVAFVLACLEFGAYFGRRRHARTGKEVDGPISTMAGALLGVLGFLLAFTFGLAGSHFDDRRRAVIEEANAIETTYLRAEMLDEPQRNDVRALLREYVDIRIEATVSGDLERALVRSGALQKALWKRAVEVGVQHPDSIVVGLFVNELNHMFDVHTKRVIAAIHTRIPVLIWATLFAVTFFGMAGTGYLTGMAGPLRSMVAMFTVLAFSSIIIIIVCLDRAGEGGLNVSQQAMLQLQRQMMD